MSNTKVLSYQENPITFGIGKDLWVNATEMAKPFNKQPKDFLRTQQAVDYCEALSRRLKCLPTDLLVVKNGGENNGTWMQQKLALRFAQWLSPDFSVWVDGMIEELLTTGKTELKTEQALPDLPKNYVEALRRLADSEEARMIAEASAKENQEKAEIVNLIVEKADNYTMQQAANVLGTGRTRFFKWLKENGYFQPNNEPYQKYIGQYAYFTVKEIPKDGKIYHTPFVTPLGLMHFAKKIEKLENIRNKKSKTLVLFNPN